MIITVPSEFRLHGRGQVAPILILVVRVTIVVVPVVIRIVVGIPIRETTKREEESISVVMEETVVIVMIGPVVAVMTEMVVMIEVIVMKGEIMSTGKMGTHRAAMKAPGSSMGTHRPSTSMKASPAMKASTSSLCPEQK